MTLMLFALLACDNPLDDLKDKIDGFVNPVVTQGAVMSIESPTDPLLQPLLQSDFAPGIQANIFLADAKNASEIESAPLEGADIVLTVDGKSAAVPETQPGVYTIKPGDEPLRYEVGAELDVSIDLGLEEGDLSTLSLVLPPVAEVTIPPNLSPDEELIVDLTGQGFNSAFVVVLDLNGGVTYTNEPVTAGDLYDLKGQAEAGLITIPASAFPADGVYAVGISGMVHTETADLSGMNTILSNFMAGKLRFNPTTVGELPTQ